MKAKFGDRVRNNSASETNPIREGTFVRWVVRQRSRCAQLTDEQGKFWEVLDGEWLENISTEAKGGMGDE